MAKYKYIGGSRPNREHNKIYDGESKVNPCCYSVSELAIKFPDKWELIEEKSPRELLIEEAKLRYPIGTKYIPTMRANDGSFEIIKGAPFLIKSGEFIQDGPGGYSIYKAKGKKWAEIIKEEPMCTEKTIKLSLDQARKMYGKNPEMDELLLANFSKEELTKKELPKSWEELPEVVGYFIGGDSEIKLCSKESIGSKTKYTNKSNFATEKQAKSALAAAQLSQLMAVYNDGWEHSWETSSSYVYVIYRQNNNIKADSFASNYCFLNFRSSAIRDEFLKNFKPLIKEYFMID